MPSFTLITPAAGEVVTLAEVKQHLRISSDSDDDYLEFLITVATRSVEGWTGRSLLEQTWLLSLERFPWALGLERSVFGGHRDIRLPRGPLRTVDEIAYTDSQGSAQILGISDLQIDRNSAPPIIRPAFGKTWPATQVALNAVRVKYTCGYSSIPETLKFAILAFVGHLNEHREVVILNSTIQKLPMHLENLLWNERIPPFDIAPDCSLSRY